MRYQTLSAKWISCWSISDIQRLDGDGGGWLATVPALLGCMGDGDTPEAALADAGRAIIEWHAAAQALGREIPGPGSPQFDGL
jgi:predicted RNase H-like HicB family nuclease